MTKEEAIEALKEHKRQIDKKYINTRNSKAIETVLSMLEEKDKTIDLMAEYIESKKILVDKYCYALTKETIKQYFENKAKIHRNRSSSRRKR
jgi:hypothetical protein